MVKEIGMELDTLQISEQPSDRHRTGRLKKHVGEHSPATAAQPSLEGIVAALEDELAQAKERQAVITQERKAIALAAHMGSAEDRARLDQLNRDGAVLFGEIESIEAAIAEAHARIATLKNTAAVEAERQRRREIVRRADELREHAAKIDSLWRASVEEYQVLQDKLHEIVQSGVGRPARHLVQTACRRALVSAFIGTPLQLELLAPGERHTVSDLVASWAANVEAWAQQPLSRPNGKDQT